MSSPRRSPFVPRLPRQSRGARLNREMNVEAAALGRCAELGKYERAGHSVAQGTINFLGQERSRKAYTVRPHCARLPVQGPKGMAWHKAIRDVTQNRDVAALYGKTKLSAAEAASYLASVRYRNVM